MYCPLKDIFHCPDSCNECLLATGVQSIIVLKDRLDDLITESDKISNAIKVMTKNINTENTNIGVGSYPPWQSLPNLEHLSYWINLLVKKWMSLGIEYTGNNNEWWVCQELYAALKKAVNAEKV